MTVRPSRGAGVSGPARRRHAAAAAVVLCAPALVIFSGCSFSVGGSNLNTEKLEREIQTGIKEQLDTDATVACPDEVKIEAGDVFECTATSASGQTAPVVVTQNDDEGNVSWRLGPEPTSTAPGTTTAP